MKLKYYIFILCLIVIITTSLSKLMFQREEESSIDILKYLFEESFFNLISKFHLIIIPLNYAKVNPYAFSNLMVNLNQHSRNSLMILDNVNENNSLTGENFLLLQFGDKVNSLLTALDSIGKDTKFSFRRVVVWFEGIESKKIKSIIKMKTATININEAIILHPILKINGSKGVKVRTE